MRKLLLFFLVPLLVTAAIHAGIPVRSVGTGSIINGDRAAARDRAIDDALRKAVETTLGTYIDAQTTVENFMVVEDRILNWSRGYVSSYQIVSESAASPDLYEVAIDAVVEETLLARDADAVRNLIQRMGYPRLMIVIDEKNIADPPDRYHYFSVDITAAETAMNSRFMEKGFKVVDPAQVRRIRERDSVLAAIQGDAAATRTLANRLDAEVIITGTAAAKTASGFNLAGMKSCQANITARAVDADVGTMLASGQKHAAFPHIDEVTGGTMAIEKAAGALADELIDRILQKWRARFYELNEVVLLVTGLSSYAQASRLAGDLNYLGRGVKNVIQRSVTGETAEFALQLSGTAAQLARELDERQIGDSLCRVTAVTANKLTLQIVQP